MALHSLSLDSSSFSAGSHARIELASKQFAYRSTLAPLEADTQILYACYGVFPLVDDDLHLKVSVIIHDRGRERRVAMFYMTVASKLLHEARFVPHFRTFPQGDIEVLAKWRSHDFEGLGPDLSREKAILQSSTGGNFPLLDWPDIGRLYRNFYSSRRGSPFIQERLDRYDTPSARRNLSKAPSKLKRKIHRQKSQFETQCDVPQSIEWHFEDVSLQMSPTCDSFSTMSSLSLSVESESSPTVEEFPSQPPFLCPRFTSALDDISSSDFGDFDIFDDSISPAQREVMLRLHKADSISPENTLQVPSLMGSDSRSSTSRRVPLLDLDILPLSDGSEAPVCVVSAQETCRSGSSDNKAGYCAPLTVLVSRPSSDKETLVADSPEVEEPSEDYEVFQTSEVEELSEDYEAFQALEVDELSEDYEAFQMEVNEHPPVEHGLSDLNLRSKLRGLQMAPTPPTVSSSNPTDLSSMFIEVSTKSSEFSKELRVVSSNEVSTRSSEHSPKVRVISAQGCGLLAERTVSGCQSPVFTLRAPLWQLDPQDR
ncbi:MAG: hypothetical protein KVP17_000165 [Porospora cf. gigantea B]|nr:MAG: hypothetical protein KVP17_000165 [Porospora cf. gigantea B]